MINILIFASVIWYGSCKEDALFNAAASGKLEIVQEMLSLGADVDSVDSTGKTALYHAAYKHHNYVVDYLLEKGAKVDVREDEQGWTALIASTSQGMYTSISIAGLQTFPQNTSLICIVETIC